MGVSKVSIVTEFKSQKYFPDNHCNSWWMQQPLEDTWSHYEAEVVGFWTPSCWSLLVLHKLVAILTPATLTSAHWFWRAFDTSQVDTRYFHARKCQQESCKISFLSVRPTTPTQPQQQQQEQQQPRPRESCHQPRHSALVKDDYISQLKTVFPC